MAIPYGYGMNDAGRRLVDSINQGAQNAIDTSGQAVESARQGLGSIQEAKPGVMGSADAMRSYAAEMAGLARDGAASVGTVRARGDELAKTAAALTQAGNTQLGVANDILNMNADSQYGAVRQLLALYGAYDPDNLVSSAAQDVNAAYSANRASMYRDMARQGVNPSSGRSEALEQQFRQVLATATAAAMTRMRAQGLKDQTAAFQSLVMGNYKDLFNQAKDAALGGASIQANAIGAEKAAADMLRNSAQIFGSAMSGEQSAAELELGYAGKEASQYNSIASALQSMASLYDTQSARELSFLNNDLQRSATIANTLASQPYVHQDLHGNTLAVGRNGNVAAANRTDDGWSVQ